MRELLATPRAAIAGAARRGCRLAQGGARMRHSVRLNPITFEAQGRCGELLPERIPLDEWGYPLLDETPLHGSEVEHAIRAARACPTFALRSEEHTSELQSLRHLVCR